MKVLAVNGYKPMELNIFKMDDPRIAFIQYAIRKRLLVFIEEGLQWVIVSGQMGVELWTAEVVLDLKESYNIKLGIFPPFENQDSRWKEEMQEYYQQLIMCADFYQPIYRGEYKGAYQFRAKNMWFTDKSDACLLLQDADFPGSTRFFYEAAKKKGNYPIYTITPADLEDAVEELAMQEPRYWEQ